jgi:DNA-binding LacI/PurR family transcriptional regulator
MQPPPTLRQLALLAGVSVASMSHALSGKGKLAAATRKRLRALAAEQGYHPRPALAALGGMRRGGGHASTGMSLLGILDDGPAPPDDLIAAAQTMGYYARAIRVGTTPAAELQRQLLAAGAVGVVLGRLTRSDLFLHAWDDLAVVCTRAIPPQCPYHRVCGDPIDAVWRAWSHLRSLGCTRIGAVLFGHRPTIQDDHERLGAALAAQHELGGGAIPPFTGAFNDDAGVAQWAQEHRPDGLLAFHTGVRYMGKAPLRRVPMVSLHLNLSRREAGFVIDERRYALAAIRVLDSALRHNDLGPSSEPLTIRLRAIWRNGA